MGACALGLGVVNYGMWVWGSPHVEPWPTELKKSVFYTLTDAELRELLHRCCLVRGAPFADQVSTLPYQRRIDKLWEILDARCAYSKNHRRALKKLPLSLDVVDAIGYLCLSR